MQFRPIVEPFGLWRLEPERRIHRGTALDAQARLIDHLAVELLRGRALRTPKCPRHLHQVVPLRLRDEAGERQQFAALFLREPRKVRAISLD
jgi:hypothetical protein